VELRVEQAALVKIQFLQNYLEVAHLPHKLHLVEVAETSPLPELLVRQVACLEVMQLEQPLPGKEILVPVVPLALEAFGPVVVVVELALPEVQVLLRKVALAEMEPHGSPTLIRPSLQI